MYNLLSCICKSRRTKVDINEYHCLFWLLRKKGNLKKMKTTNKEWPLRDTTSNSHIKGGSHVKFQLSPTFHRIVRIFFRNFAELWVLLWREFCRSIGTTRNVPQFPELRPGLSLDLQNHEPNILQNGWHVRRIRRQVKIPLPPSSLTELVVGN